MDLKKTFFVILLALTLILPFVSDAAVRVRGYTRKDGTYVQPHYRSNPDGNPYNNWSFPGNTNPYTGKVAPGNSDTYLENYYDKSNSSYTLPSVPSYSASSYIPLTSSSDTYQSLDGGYRSYGVLFCSSGYYKENDSCKKAPENGYALYTDFSCSIGFEKSGDQCIRESKPNAYWNGTGYSCNSGFIPNTYRDTCISIGTACKENFGAFARAYNESQCICFDGYEWNISRTSCVQKIVTPLPSPPVESRYIFSRKLALDMEGQDVKELQLLLNKLDYLEIPPGMVLGYFGEPTMQALIKYQISLRLPPVGILGPATRNKINNRN